jgi:hypothetical protein
MKAVEINHGKINNLAVIVSIQTSHVIEQIIPIVNVSNIKDCMVQHDLLEMIEIKDETLKEKASIESKNQDVIKSETSRGP